MRVGGLRHGKFDHFALLQNLREREKRAKTRPSANPAGPLDTSWVFLSTPWRHIYGLYYVC